jgi:hypothetical protein
MSRQCLRVAWRRKTSMAETSPAMTPRGRSIPHIILPLAPVEAAGAQAAGLEICVRSRTGRGRCGRAFRSAPCRRGRCGRRGARASRKDNPRLRLRVTSKARQVVVIVIVWHDTPPWFGSARYARSYGSAIARCPASRQPRLPKKHFTNGYDCHLASEAALLTGTARNRATAVLRADWNAAESASIGVGSGILLAIVRN